MFSLGNGFQVRNLLVSCRSSRYRKPTRLLTRACSPRMASSVTLRAVLGIQISLLFTRNTWRFGKYQIIFFNRAALKSLHERSNTAFRLDWLLEDMVETSHNRRHSSRFESSSRQEPTRSNKVKGCETLACKHMNSRHSATYRCDLCMAQTFETRASPDAKKTVDCGPATFRQNVCPW